MTAPETGPEIPADELVERLRRYPYPMGAAADLIEAQAARLASLEAERAKTVEPDKEVLAILDSHDGYARWAVVGFPIGAVRKLCGLSEWQYARRQALASEKGQADG